MSWHIDDNGVSDQMQRTSFGELSVAENTPIVQVSAQYGLTDEVVSIVSNGGSTDGANSLFTANSGTHPLGIGSINTTKQLAYKPGQGALCRLTGVFSPQQNGSLQVCGLINSEDGFGFGYFDLGGESNGEFGIIYSRNGDVELQELTISTPASGNENANITINDVMWVVPLTSGTVEHNAWEIAESLTVQVPNFLFTSNGDAVVVMSQLPGEQGVYDFSSATAIATFNQLKSGVEPTISLVKQSDWNRNKTPWLNPQLGNVFSISIQYLGFGNISFYVEDPKTKKQLLVHMIEYANSAIIPSVGNPTFRIGWLARNFGNTVDLSVSGASAAGFIEGKRNIDTLPRGSELVSAAVIGETQTNLITIRNRFHFGDRINRAELIPLLLSLGTESTKGAFFRLTANATFGGDMDFEYIDRDSSIAEVAKTPVVVTGGRFIASFLVTTAGAIVSSSDFKTVVLPDDYITLSSAVTKTPAAIMTASAVWQEDI